MKKIGNWLSNILLVIVLLIAISFVHNAYQTRQNPGHIPSTFGYMSLAVLSDSMNPAIKTGDMIFVKNDKENLKVGDIVTYDAGEFLITHRIIEIKNENGNILYITKGDANNSADPKPVTVEQIIGSYKFRIPYAGYAKDGLRGWPGFTIIMGLLMIYFITTAIKASKTQLSKVKDSNQ